MRAVQNQKKKYKTDDQNSKRSKTDNCNEMQHDNLSFIVDRKDE